MQLVETLRDKGLTTRKTAQRPERDVSFTSLLNMLRNPYYMGVVTYQGVTYEGQHKALVTPEVWLRVQDVLAAHAHAGEKDRIHTHYLRGTIFCGGCGKRLIFSRNVGRGGAYDYFLCPKRRSNTVHCTRKAVRVERIEDGIVELYRRFELPVESVHSIRLGVQAEMAADSAAAHGQAERANRTLEKLGRERTTLMQAHYQGAIPLELLKSEMERLTTAMRAAQRQVELSGKHISDVEDVLEQALAVAGSCHTHYVGAPDFVKRQINQGFFKRLMIQQDGTVEQVELTEPFAALMAWNGAGGLTAARKGRSKIAGTDEGQAELRKDDNTPTSGEGRGVNEDSLVELLRRYSNHHGLVTPLVSVLRHVHAGDQSGPAAVQSAPPSPRWLSSKLAAGDQERMAEQYMAGATAAALAERYGISLKSVKRTLQERGARKRA